MKKLFTTLLTVAITCTSIWAQSPEAFKYQSVIRNASGEVVASQKVSLRISILQGSTSGKTVYAETHIPSTNEFGLISLEIGKGTVLSGSLSTINWGNSSYFLQTELDLNGGSTFVLLGASQLLSVPYALYAKTAGNGFSGNYNDLTNKPTKVSTFTNDAGYLKTETDPLFGASVAKTIDAEDTLRWGKKFSGNYNDLTNKPTKVSTFTNDAGYLKTETDPVFGASVAKDIDTEDTLRWGKKLPVGKAGNLLTYDGSNWIAKDLVITSAIAGGSQPFSIIPPYLCVNYCIAMAGIFPSSNGDSPFLAEIMLFGGTFAPRGYAFCNGQLLSIAQNTALFSLLGTTFGGNGQTTFALPDLRGRFAMHAGTGPGLSTRVIGEKSGTETQTLTINQMPAHNHIILK